MSMFEFLIKPDDGEPFEISAGLRDIRMWEKTHPKRSMGQLQDGAGISAIILFEVAYAALRRQGRLPEGLSEDAFAALYDIEVETPEEKRARLAAEKFRDDARAAIAAEEEGRDSLDPTHAAASAAAW